ncbi:hypothetical protein F0L17_22725 [Streptomyces sp. TRM43335]|uniref:RHS repeat-associated core domain-containing protein n=1 Tax=Streptomyces taklimakanensis TaxID=2569853 RepID=A0A6G2BHW1_9ACTN|nr:hypothetical protein [Streptomyces taklimakanensis]
MFDAISYRTLFSWVLVGSGRPISPSDRNGNGCGAGPPTGRGSCRATGRQSDGNKPPPGEVVLHLTDIHGDVALRLPLGAGKAPVALDNDEYGNPRTGRSAVRYGRLGPQQRSAETLTGLTLTGVRLYAPTRGRFLRTDPVHGGSANAYDYSNADPCDASDTDGLRPRGGKRRIGNGYGMRILTGRRGGGVAKNGYRYMGSYINVQVTGFANRYFAKNATQAETWGVKPRAGAGRWSSPKQEELVHAVEDPVGGPPQHPGEARDSGPDRRQGQGVGTERLRGHHDRLVHSQVTRVVRG